MPYSHRHAEDEHPRRAHRGAVYSPGNTSKASQAQPGTFWADKSEELAWAQQQCPKRDGWEIVLGVRSPRSSTRFFVLKKGHKRGWETYAPGCKSDAQSDCGFASAAEAVECYNNLFR